FYSLFLSFSYHPAHTYIYTLSLHDALPILQKLSLELPIEFFGQAEVIGFTQYVYGQVKEIFPNDYDTEVTISSSDGEESLIFRRSEEHTSELQSRFDLVCRLLLEKKKHKNK